MKVKALHWLGTRTDEHEATAAFFRDVLGLPVDGFLYELTEEWGPAG